MFDEKSYSLKMDKAIEVFSKELSSLRTGRANAAMLDLVKVDVYGQQMPINQVGSVTTPEPRMINIQVWDANNVPLVDAAIKKSDLGLNPQIDGQLVRLPVPELNEERRTELKKLIEEKSDKQVFFVYGGVAAEEREKIRFITEKSEGAIIVASYGTFSTGINIRNLHNIVFASPSKSRIRNLQSIGRGLRLKDNDSDATLYDIADDLTHNEKENYTLSHFRERINIYNEEDFEYEIHNVELK